MIINYLPKEANPTTITQTIIHHLQTKHNLNIYPIAPGHYRLHKGKWWKNTPEIQLKIGQHKATAWIVDTYTLSAQGHTTTTSPPYESPNFFTTLDMIATTMLAEQQDLLMRRNIPLSSLETP